jgi:hypothetical protein
MAAVEEDSDSDENELKLTDLGKEEVPEQTCKMLNLGLPRLEA